MFLYFSFPLSRTSLPAAPSSSPSTGIKKPTLDSSMPWDLSVVIKKEGYADIQADLRLRFVAEPGYEPPQGRIFVERDQRALIDTDDKGFALTPSPAWTLSEDKDDRQWGLWIWGLFAEPLFPYLYMTLPVLDECLADVVGEDGEKRKEMRPVFGGTGIPGRRLDFRFNHVREDGATVLSEGKVTFKEVEMQKVDPLGIGGLVNVGDIKEAGEAQLRPVLV
ncbi:hypothetical protein VYU27_004747 [Nannochloropsis oceanica]